MPDFPRPFACSVCLRANGTGSMYSSGLGAGVQRDADFGLLACRHPFGRSDLRIPTLLVPHSHRPSSRKVCEIEEEHNMLAPCLLCNRTHSTAVMSRTLHVLCAMYMQQHTQVLSFCRDYETRAGSQVNDASMLTVRISCVLNRRGVIHPETLPCCTHP